MKLCTGSLAKRRVMHQFINEYCPGISNLETFWNKSGVEASIRDLPGKWLLVDSGAHSLYNKYVAPAGGRFLSDFSWVQGKDFKTYLESYIKWLHSNKDKVGAFVGLDVIGSAKHTWDVQQYIESCGLLPMPVYHYGDDILWLDKYVAKYRYVGIGGIATGGDNIKFLDTIFRRIGKTKDGRCNVDLHGFAVTDVKSMMRYPFFSVDSISWTLFAAYGWALFPTMLKNGGYEFGQPVVVKGSRVRSNSKAGMHMHEYTHAVGEDRVIGYLTEMGLWDESKSIAELMDVTDTRCKMNLYYYSHLQEVLSKKTDWDIWTLNQRKFV